MLFIFWNWYSIVDYLWWKLHSLRALILIYYYGQRKFKIYLNQTCAKEIQNMLCEGKILKSVKYLEGWLGHYSYWLILYHLGIRPLVNTAMRLLVTDVGGGGVLYFTTCKWWGRWCACCLAGSPTWTPTTDCKHGTYPIVKLSSFTSFLSRN